MSNERGRTVHPAWCDPEACTAPEFESTNEEYRAARPGGLGRHRSKVLLADPHRAGDGLKIYLYQSIAPWECATFLAFQRGEGEYPDVVSTEVGDNGVGFDLFELLGLVVTDAVRKYPNLYEERFPDVQRAIEEEADAATADAVMPRDPVELAEMMAAEHDYTMGSAEIAPGPQDVVEVGVVYDLTINGKTGRYATFRDVRAVVADLVTRRLGAEPERVGQEAALLNQAFQPGGEVETLLNELGDWYTVFDAYGEEPLRLRITIEV